MPKMTRGTLAGGLSECQHSAFDFILAAHRGCEQKRCNGRIPKTDSEILNFFLCFLADRGPKLQSYVSLWRHYCFLDSSWQACRMCRCLWMVDMWDPYTFTHLVSQLHRWSDQGAFNRCPPSFFWEGGGSVFHMFPSKPFDSTQQIILFPREKTNINNLRWIQGRILQEKYPITYPILPKVRDLLLGKEPDDLDLTLCLRDCPEEADGNHERKQKWGPSVMEVFTTLEGNGCYINLKRFGVCIDRFRDIKQSRWHHTIAINDKIAPSQRNIFAGPWSLRVMVNRLNWPMEVTVAALLDEMKGYVESRHSLAHWSSNPYICTDSVCNIFI